VIFLSNTIKTPSTQETEHRKKERKRGRKNIEKKERKLQEFLQIKEEVHNLRGENTSTSKILFYMIPFSPPPSYHFENLFSNH
jgi:hypothetical protein